MFHRRVFVSTSLAVADLPNSTASMVWAALLTRKYSDRPFSITESVGGQHEHSARDTTEGS